MDFIEKLFNQHSFIYCIGEKYYAFSTGVCAECDKRSITLESRYREYVNGLGEELTQREEWKIQFNNDEMNELKMQVDRYLEYWKKYSLKDFV